MTPVHGSSNVAAQDYNPQTGVLSVRFRSGDTYHYRHVTRDMHKEFLAASSPGQWVADKLVPRKVQHPYVREVAKKKK